MKARRIPLSNGGFIRVDSSDYSACSQHKWFKFLVGRSYYAMTYIDREQVLLHRFLLSPPPEKHVDHANGDGLDNRRENLRVCSRAENMQTQRKKVGTQSTFKGICKTGSGRWSASIEQSENRLYLGAFDTEVEAAKQYDRAARVFFGRFARTNEMLGLYN